MKLSHQLSLCFVVLFLLTAIVFSGHNLAQAEEKPVAERLVSVNLEDQDFTQALKAIADQAGITINIHGQMPQTKRDLFLKQVPLNQALAQVLRLYGVRNHAAAYNPETGTVMLAILETSTLVAALTPQAQPKNDMENDHNLTQEQLAKLQDYSNLMIAEIDHDHEFLSYEQQEMMKEHSDRMEGETKDDSLTPEQIQKLIEYSAQHDFQETDVDTPLREDQIEELRNYSSQKNQETDMDTTILSPEQIEVMRQESEL
jgi:hypothetical protein